MNTVILGGYFARDPELRYTQNQKAVASFCIGTREANDKTEWHNCIAWEKQADFISKYFHKGSYIGIVGHLQTRKWEDKDGKTMYTTEVIVDKAEFGGSKKEETQQEFTPITDDDLPF